MADRTRIEWTDATWNPIRGCTRVSEGCKHCYAETMAARFNRPGQWGHGLAEMATRPDGSREARWTGKTVFDERTLIQPLRWRKPRRVFVCSTSDLFHEANPDEWIDRMFAVMALSPQHTFQVLTKRPERMRDYLNNDPWDAINSHAGTLMHWDDMPVAAWPLPNVWLGVSAEDQAAADERVPALLNTPAAVRFLSAEPLLGPIDLTACPRDDSLLGYAPDDDGDRNNIDWVICGGESGPGARPMHPGWARILRDQCQAAGVAFFFKQHGHFLHESQQDVNGRALLDAWQGGGDDGEEGWHEWQDGSASLRIGKKRAGRRLDGREWSEMPE